MARKQTAWKTKGMNRDLSVSAFNPEFSFENRNLRLITNESNTMLSWVNEKGTAEINIVEAVTNNGTTSYSTVTLTGTAIGTAVIDHKLIVFLTSTGGTPDSIMSLRYITIDGYTGPTMLRTILFRGNLHFNAQYPIETLVSYESDSIQKVYWTDNLNQPRMINVAAEDTSKYCDTSFDFVNELNLGEKVYVEKILGAGGTFAPGVIQYAFTYYRKNGQESHIFYTTPLLYISHLDRGAAPDEKVDNAFKITITHLDYQVFDYVRIYSIQRTSINAVPIVKRVQDISLEDIDSSTDEISYIDSGTSGNTVAPTDLLFKGGEVITAKTLEQKDGTLFLGNVNTNREIMDVHNLVLGRTEFIENPVPVRYFTVPQYTGGTYRYSNQLSATTTRNGRTISVPCGGFKKGDIYRCGVQFQHKSGKWSDPIYLNDVEVKGTPQENYLTNTISVPTLKAALSFSSEESLILKDFRKARPVVVFPEIKDRVCICQGVACQTLFTNNHRQDTMDNDLYAQASWFFRPYIKASEEDTSDYIVNNHGAVAPKSLHGPLRYARRGISAGTPAGEASAYDPDSEHIRQVEVQGAFTGDHKFQIDDDMLTLHSPDIEFDTDVQNTSFENIACYQVGQENFTGTLSDIEILTETPTASSSGSGFVHKSFATSNACGIISGLFYDDFILDDNESSSKEIRPSKDLKSSQKWMVYLWNKSGSLNNDISRPADKGIATAVLKKKTISNLRFAETSYSTAVQKSLEADTNPDIFASDEATIIKIGTHIYQGNIDSVVIPDYSDGMYFAFNNSDIKAEYVDTPFYPEYPNTDTWWKTFANSGGDGNGIYKKGTTNWEKITGMSSNIGDDYVDMVMKKDPVRIKYKSTSHLVISFDKNATGTNLITWANSKLPIIEVSRHDTNNESAFNNFKNNIIFGGKTPDAFKENIWVPCGEPVPLVFNDGWIEDIELNYDYGDTYYQRWDCLKTYPFTLEDINQVIEIGSFMLETRVNIDGRYDRNRGQLSNIYASPRNFNLLNPVYSQKDNFFSYRIQDDDYYKSTTYPNQITWSLTKQSGADVDLWTDITLASVLELDGNKGEINKLTRYNDQLIAFQDSGIAQILYNENVQIAASNDVPIEIANSGKVQGSRYLSDTIGCSDKWSVVSTPLGVYFMDSNNKGIYMFNGQLSNVTLTKGFSSWARQRIPSGDKLWNSLSPAYGPDGFSNFVSYYDKVNQDVLFIDKNEALAFSEKVMAFTSFYDYGGTPYFDNLDDTGIWIRNERTVPSGSSTPVLTCTLHKHNAGLYCRFFEFNKPYSMTLIGNPEPQLDKIFTNLEFRACVDGEGTISSDVFTPSLPFDFLETWDEYQHGTASLGIRNGHAASLHHLNNTTGEGASLKRDFRIWRCDIPRDNTPKTSEQMAGYNYTLDTELGITRFSRRPMDRMRNPWLYLKLKKNAGSLANPLPRAEIHDMMMTYFG